MFEEFFFSMRMDASTVLCRTLDDTILYMQGSAAVIGDFMLPLLMPDATEEERAAARPHARDLGIAFQLTNFIRDIDEDLDLNRQYIPEDICQQFGVKISLRDNDQEGLPQMIEHLFSIADNYYKSADIGIEMLPGVAGEVCRAASLMYHAIHDEIRNRKYAIYSGRAKVPFRKKLKIFSSVVSKGQIARMVSQEISARVVAKVDSLLVPCSFLFCVWLLTGTFNMPTATYAQFHLMFTIPQVVLALYLAKRWAPSTKYWTRGCAWTAVLCVVATVYSTPWDNYLVASGVWGYGGNNSGRVLGTIGYVPIEEYAFFSLETIMVAAVWLATQVVQEPPPLYTPKPWRMLGLTFMAVVFMAGCLMLKTQNGFYLGLILVWALPVLAIQWAFGADALMAQRKIWLGPLLSVWIYLCLADRWAIRNGIWSLNPNLTLPLIDILPIEEALFFLLSSMMCLWGLVLAQTTSMLEGSSFLQSLWQVYCWSQKCKPRPKTRWITTDLRPVAISLAALVSVVCLSNMSLSLQMIVLGPLCFLFGLLSLVQVAFEVKAVNQNLQSLVILCLIVYMHNICCWVLLPTVAFKIFLCMMIYRFGKGDSSTDPASLPVVDTFARGGLFLFLIRFHPSQIADCFTYLIGGQYDVMLSSMSFMNVLGTVHMFAVVLSLLYHGLKCHEGPHLAILHEIGTLIIVFWKLPPALSIVVYMTVFHGSRRLICLSRFSIIKGTDEMRQTMWRCASMALVFLASMAFFSMEDAAVDFAHMRDPRILASQLFDNRTGSKSSKLVDFSFIWLSSTTMLNIILTAKFGQTNSQSEMSMYSRRTNRPIPV
jgi:Brp/Blh family beta-carotene 15,15'-monooxygenase